MPKSLNSGVLCLMNTQTRATVDDGLTSQRMQNPETTLGIWPATQKAKTQPDSKPLRVWNEDTTSTLRPGRRTFSQIVRTPLQPLSSMRIMQGSVRPEETPCLDTGGRTNQPLFHDDTLDLSLMPNSEVWDWAQTRRGMSMRLLSSTSPRARTVIDQSPKEGVRTATLPAWICPHGI